GTRALRLLRPRRLARPRARGSRPRRRPALDPPARAPRGPRLRGVPSREPRHATDRGRDRDAVAPLYRPLAGGGPLTRRAARARPRGRGSRMARRRLPAAPGGRAAPRTRARAPHASPPRHAVGQPARPARTAPLRLELRLRGTAGARRRGVRTVDHGRRRAGARAVRRGVSRAARPRRPSAAPGDLGDRRPVRPARPRAADPRVAAAALDPAPAAPVVARLGGAPQRSARSRLARGGPGLTCRSGPTSTSCAAAWRRR